MGVKRKCTILNEKIQRGNSLNRMRSEDFFEIKSKRNVEHAREPDPA